MRAPTCGTSRGGVPRARSEKRARELGGTYTRCFRGALLPVMPLLTGQTWLNTGILETTKIAKLARLPYFFSRESAPSAENRSSSGAAERRRTAVAELRGGLAHAYGCRVVKGVSDARGCSVRVWQCQKSLRFFSRNDVHVTSHEAKNAENFRFAPKRHVRLTWKKRVERRLVSALPHSPEHARARSSRASRSRASRSRGRTLSCARTPPLSTRKPHPLPPFRRQKRTNRRPPREIRPRREADPAVSRCPPCFATCSPAWRGPTQRRGWCTTTPSGTSRS